MTVCCLFTAETARSFGGAEIDSIVIKRLADLNDEDIADDRCLTGPPISSRHYEKYTVPKPLQIA